MNAGRHRHLTIVSIHPGPSVGVARALLRVVALGVMTAILAGCLARPVGDFGRAKPGVLHDQVMPAIGDFAAKQRREPVSNFNLTDQERLMHDRTWRFLVAAHGRDWMFNTSVELQRTRIGRARDHTFTTERYYTWLRETQYRSSTTRYATVGRAIAADLDTVGPTFAAICAVQEVDRQRQAALSNLAGIEAEVAANSAARREENQWHIDWFVRALTYRYDSYAYALDHLLVETPHEQSMSVDASLQQLRPWVDRARRGDFCGAAGVNPNHNAVALPSRFERMVQDNEVVLPK